MKHGNMFFLLPFIIALPLLAVLLIATPVFAQDELPPEAPVPTEEIPVVEENPITEQIPTDVAPVEPVEEPAADPVAVSAEGSSGVPVEETPAESLPLILEAVADAGLILADDAGEPLNLVAAETAESLPLVDPWFKVGTVTYSFTPTDCNPDVAGNQPCSNPLQAAVDYISANGKVPSDGFIHVDAGTLNNQEVYVNGLQPYLNSLKGIMGVVDPNTFKPSTILDDTAGNGSFIHVTNKMNGFTLSGLDIRGDRDGYGVVDFHIIGGSILLQDLVIQNDSSGGVGIAISIHNGLLTLKNVDSSHNAGGGAIIDNSSGTSGVTISNSSFDDNMGNSYANGLRIITKGAVSISGVSASRNLSTDPGLWVQGGSTVTIKSSIANGNTAGRGIDIQNVSGAVSLTTVTANGNGLTGLYVRNRGSITLSTVEASQNLGVGSLGADLDNTSSGSTVGVTVTNGTFENNYTTGLQINTKGNIILTNTASWDNDSTAGSYGADLNNASGTGYVKITNLPSTEETMQPGFNNNHDRGVNIHTNGTVTLTNVNILNNQEEGIYVWQELNKGVTLTNCWVDSNLDSFGVAGILINSVGPIVINGGHADHNNGYGVWAHNEIALDSAPKPVTISNFTANGNNGFGIRIESKGAIKLTNVAVKWTFGGLENAIRLDNHWLTAGVTLSNVTADENIYDGIFITTRGTVNLTKINANRNINYGLYINQTGTAYPTVTITTGHFWFNDYYGLVIYGRGSITLKDISADDNEGNGAYIQNESGNVSLLASSTGGNTFNYNYGVHNGLDINTRGTVTLNKVTATGNDGSGVYLWSTATGYTGNVVINGGTFEGGGQQDYGLVALSNGTITLNNITANDNDFDGIHLNNTYDTTGAKGIIVTRTWVHGNGNIGLLADSYGSITVNGIDAQENADRGVDLDNTYGAFSTPKNISVLGITGFNNISGNGAQGLYILSEGAVSVSKLNLTHNVGHAVYINNYESGLGKGTVTLSYLNIKNNNSRGITIESNNAVSLKYLTVLYNGSGSHGISVNTHNHNLLLTGSTISGNGAYGLYGTIGTGVFSLSSTYYFGNRGAYNIYIAH